MSEEIIIKHCAPTLAGIKTGSLFSVRVPKEKDINLEVRKLNSILRQKGIRIIPLRKTGEKALIYLFRPEHLKKDLKDPNAKRILKRKGYKFEKPECCIVQLIRHLNNDDTFPHEIGLFLGYPPLDVQCFMEHPCDGVKCCGCWKAYSDPEKARKTFERYKICTDTFYKMYKNGKSLAQLAV
ncbi:MAG: DUF3793 family protein [Lachnospiraceae bacterium]|nr:DUF3793 family protein [Lachnospiraceae bacterium]